MLLIRLSSSSSPFISSITPHLRLSPPSLLQALQLQSLARPKSPFFSIGPVSPLFCLPIPSQRLFCPKSSPLQLLKLMQHRALQLHAQGGDSMVGGASEEKGLILDGAGGNGSGSGSVAMEVLDGKDVNLGADGNGVGTGPPSINFVGDASSNSSNSSGGRETRIKVKLERGLCPVELQVEDISYQHAGHAAVRGNSNGETHFNVKIVSKEFEGKSLVKRHRLIYGLLQEELQSGLHALSIVAKTPSEVGTK